MRTFDGRFKRKVVREYLSGKGGYKILAAKFDIADSLIRRWVAAGIPPISRTHSLSTL